MCARQTGDMSQQKTNPLANDEHRATEKERSRKRRVGERLAFPVDFIHILLFLFKFSSCPALNRWQGELQPVKGT